MIKRKIDIKQIVPTRWSVIQQIEIVAEKRGVDILKFHKLKLKENISNHTSYIIIRIKKARIYRAILMIKDQFYLGICAASLLPLSVEAYFTAAKAFTTPPVLLNSEKLILSSSVPGIMVSTFGVDTVFSIHSLI